MLAETVVIDVGPGASDKSLGQAHVTASFTMHNLGDVDESMAARFPIGSSDGYFRVNELRDLQIKVAGKRVPTRRIVGEDPYFGSSSTVPWAEFDVTFPAGQDTPVEVQYTLEGSGYSPFIWFKYVLSSGAGWKDSIGSADIIVHLPYEANVQNVLVDNDQVWFGTTRDGVFDGNSIRWHYTDLEPTTDDNFEVNLVMPSLWERLLAEQNNVAQNPRDGEAWGRLGKLCKQMTFSPKMGFRSAGPLDPGGAELYQLSLKAYDQAVNLLPKDALWHAGYADLLGYHAYVDASFNGASTGEEALHSFREIHTALELAPSDPQVQQIAGQLAAFFPDAIQYSPDSKEFLFPGLTATPADNLSTMPPPTEVTGVIQASATPAQISTSTPQITPTAPPTQAPASKPSSPVCGATMFLPAVLVALVFTRSYAIKRRKINQ
jgi:hypothetical protein